MYIKEVTIDGFKSYAQRVVVPEFDRYFNAITVRENEERAGRAHADVRNDARSSSRAASHPTLVSFCLQGLNGTGKSNILDAIVFVLGISNLSQVGGRRREQQATAAAAVAFGVSEREKSDRGALPRAHCARPTQVTRARCAHRCPGRPLTRERAEKVRTRSPDFTH